MPCSDEPAELLPPDGDGYDTERERRDDADDRDGVPREFGRCTPRASDAQDRAGRGGETSRSNAPSGVARHLTFHRAVSSKLVARAVIGTAADDALETQGVSMNITLWIVASVLALLFLASGASKIVQSREKI